MRYIKPKSVTWWASLVPLAAGITKALAMNWPGGDPVVGVIDAVFGDAEPGTLIDAGLVGIGLRGAVK